MSADTVTATATDARVLAPCTVRAFAGDWALFTDWCAVTGNWELPADPDTVAGFLAAWPAAPATLRRRVAAIDHHHTRAGCAPPGRSAVVLAALGRPTTEPPGTPRNLDAVHAALRGLPSHGWTHGMFGRRDRCLLVLSQLAGVPYKELATLTVGTITLAGGTARGQTAAGTWTLTSVDDPILCGPCAVTRWLQVLDAAVTQISTRAVAGLLKNADELAADGPHFCLEPPALDDATLAAPLLVPIDQWGALPFPLHRLTPHSLSRRVRDLLAGDLGAHRSLDVDTEETAEPPKPATVSAPAVQVYGREEAQRAWARRRADLQRLAHLDEVLDDVDRRAAEATRRTAAVLADHDDCAGNLGPYES